MTAPCPGVVQRALVVSLLVFALGCSESTTAVPSIVHPTLVTVPPDAFLGNVPCLDAPGAMRTYVATLRHQGPAFDEGAGGESGLSPGDAGAGGGEGTVIDPPVTSSPLDCSTAIGFGQVRPDHLYLADVYAFDRDGLGLAPRDAGEAAPEVPVVIDLETGEPVAARWTTRCHEVTARYALVRRMHDCDPLVDHVPPGPAVVEVLFDSALGERACGPGAGEIDHFEAATPTGTVVAPCGEPLVLSDVPAERSLVLPVLAFEAGASGPVLGTTCVAEPHQGVTVTASCDAFTDKGALVVDPLTASAALGLECTALRELTLTLAGTAPRRVRPSDCVRPVDFTGLGAGVQQVSVIGTLSDGSASGTAFCSAAIVPAQRATTTCAPEP